MKAILATTLGVTAVVAGIAVPIVVAVRQQNQLRHFFTVREGVLYRSAQLSHVGLQRVVRETGVRTIVSLRDGSTESDRAEEAFCRAHGIRFLRIAPLSWDGVQGSTPIDGGLQTFLDAVRDPAQRPVLVHCFRGVHRTGQYVAAYRVEYEGWSVERALKEMVDLGYDLLGEHRDVRGYFASYQRTGRYPLLAVAQPTR